MQINKIYMAQWRTSSYLYLDCDFGLVTNTSYSVVQEKHKWQNYYLKQKKNNLDIDGLIDEFIWRQKSCCSL